MPILPLCALAKPQPERPAGRQDMQWCHSFSKERLLHLSMWDTLDTGSALRHWHNPFLKRVCSQGASARHEQADCRAGRTRRSRAKGAGGRASEHACSILPAPFSAVSRRVASSETESEAGDIMDQQFEEMNNRLNSVTDPTGFLRMVRRNNLF